MCIEQHHEEYICFTCADLQDRLSGICLQLLFMNHSNTNSEHLAFAVSHA